MISAVAEMYNIHPQTLRLYEREGLLVPSRLAGVEIILNMRRRMEEMQKEMQAFVEFVRQELLQRPGESQERIENALVRIAPPRLTRTKRNQEG
jgi:MerR family transcriptional regulator/heat shock protein HspR